MFKVVDDENTRKHLKINWRHFKMSLLNVIFVFSFLPSAAFLWWRPVDVAPWWSAATSCGENMKKPSCCCRNLHLTLIISPAGCATKHIWGGEVSVFSVLTPGCAFFSLHAGHPSLPNGSVSKRLRRKTLRALSSQNDGQPLKKIALRFGSWRN